MFGVLVMWWLKPLGVLAAIVLAESVAKASERERPSRTPGSRVDDGTGVPVKLRLTGYWPFTATTSERTMEGGQHDRLSHPLYTVEDFFAGKAAYVSLSGDDSIWPYGQKIIIPWFDREITGRVVDTGSHFRGANKKIHDSGYEPIDVCVYSKDTKVPKLVTAKVIEGDILTPGHTAVADLRGTVAYGNLGKAPSTVAGGFCLDTHHDRDDEEDDLVRF